MRGAPAAALGCLCLAVACGDARPGRDDVEAAPVSTIEQAGPGFYQDVSWSPDGRELLVSVLDWGEGPDGYAYRIHAIRLDGTGFEPLTDGPRERWTAWTPDGRIVYAAERDGNDDLWLMDRGGGQPRRLTDDPAADSHPAVSPADGRIAFVSRRTGRPELWIMGPDGGDPRLLFDAEGEPNNPAWSPDGRWLTFFTSDADGPDHVWVVRPDGREPRRVAEGIWPSWSSDGTHVLYEGSDGLYRAEPGGDGEPDLLVRGAGFARLSPDGRRLAFVASDSTHVSLRVSRADGTGPVTLLRRPRPDW